mmetsp:Transcript_15618/g.35757  ORF Transcript_15618/g.35757 Transcript_15618/m.35757 type:complete len:230 (-) Transcript_15618:264-953(-)
MAKEDPSALLQLEAPLPDGLLPLRAQEVPQRIRKDDLPLPLLSSSLPLLHQHRPRAEGKTVVESSVRPAPLHNLVIASSEEDADPVQRQLNAHAKLKMLQHRVLRVILASSDLPGIQAGQLGRFDRVLRFVRFALRSSWHGLLPPLHGSRSLTYGAESFAIFAFRGGDEAAGQLGDEKGPAADEDEAVQPREDKRREREEHGSEKRRAEDRHGHVKRIDRTEGQGDWRE